MRSACETSWRVGRHASPSGQAINLVLIHHHHRVEFGLPATVSTVLLQLGGVWMFIVGYGIFRGHGELGPDSGSGQP